MINITTHKRGAVLRQGRRILVTFRTDRDSFCDSNDLRFMAELANGLLEREFAAAQGGSQVNMVKAMMGELRSVLAPKPKALVLNRPNRADVGLHGRIRHHRLVKA